MAKFNEKAFFTLVRDIDGEPIKYEVKPTDAEIEAAIKSGTNLYLKKAPMTVQYALKTALRSDLGEQTAQGRTPDPHQDKKYEIYSLLGKISKFQEVDYDVVLESEEITILKDRIKKCFNVEVFGFLVDFLEGKIN